MAKDETAGDTGFLGCALAFNTKVMPGFVHVTFDTGAILIVPTRLFDAMSFHPQEADPEPPKTKGR